MEKDWLPLEVYLLNYIRHVFVYPQIRLMETENIYAYYDEKRKEEKKMKVQSAKGKKGVRTQHGKRK